MTLSDLRADPEHFGVEAPFMAAMLERYNGEDTFTPAADVTQMFLEEARRALSSELPPVVGAPIDWPGYNLSIGTAGHLPTWKSLLSRKQLELFYDWLPEGEGSENWRRWKRYRSEWNAALVGISATINGSGGTSTSRTVIVGL